MRFGLLLLALLTLFGGCKSYKLGPVGESKFDTLYIAPVRNESYAAQAQGLLTSQLRESFLTNSGPLIEEAHYADAHLTVTLLSLDSEVAVRQSNDTQRARSYDLHLKARWHLRHRFEKHEREGEVEVSLPIFSDDGLEPATHEAMPVLTSRLAEQIRAAVVDTW